MRLETVRHRPASGLWEIQSVRRTSRFLWTVEGHGLVLLTFMSFFPRWSHVAEYLFIGFLIGAGILIWVEGESFLVRTPIDVPLLLFAGWVLLSVPFATDPTYSFAEWRKLVMKILVFYWAVLLFKHERERNPLHGVLAAVVVGTATISLYALADFLASGGSWRDRLVRAGAPSSDYNWLSTYLIIAIPILAVTACTARRQWQRLATAGTLGLALVGQAVSYTRAGWLGLLVEVLTFGWLTRHRKLTTVLLAASVVLGMAFLAASKVGYHRATVSAETWEYRVALWKKGAGEIIAYPVFGVGYGNDTYTKKYGGHPVTKDPTGLHNMFLMVALGSGVPALIFLLWTLGAAGTSLVRRAREQLSQGQGMLMLGIAVMIAGFAVRNLFDYMFAGSLACLFWILTAAGLQEVTYKEGLSAGQRRPNN